MKDAVFNEITISALSESELLSAGFKAKSGYYCYGNALKARKAVIIDLALSDDNADAIQIAKELVKFRSPGCAVIVSDFSRPVDIPPFRSALVVIADRSFSVAEHVAVAGLLKMRLVHSDGDKNDGQYFSRFAALPALNAFSAEFDSEGGVITFTYFYPETLDRFIMELTRQSLTLDDQLMSMYRLETLTHTEIFVTDRKLYELMRFFGADGDGEQIAAESYVGNISARKVLLRSDGSEDAIKAIACFMEEYNG